MTEFRKGDKVRVAFEAKVANVADDGERLWVYHAGVSDTYLNVSDVELIEAADDPDAAEQSSVCDKCGSRIVDDPSKDPIGTVRKAGNGLIVVRGHRYDRSEHNLYRPAWLAVTGSSTHQDDQVTGWEVIGAVPGTPAAAKLTAVEDAVSSRASDPAAEAQAERPLWTGESTAARQSVADDPKRELWVGDGSEEPPAHVTKVKAAQGAVVYRTAGRWAWSEATRRGWVWMPHMRSMGPFTEVRDD